MNFKKRTDKKKKTDCFLRNNDIKIGNAHMYYVLICIKYTYDYGERDSRCGQDGVHT